MMGFDGILDVIFAILRGMVPAAKTPLNQLFYSGNHRLVIENTLDRAGAAYSIEEFPFVLGALIYLGRIDEAERLFHMKEALLEPSDLIKCRYFLGVGLCRHSFYEKSRKYFVRNFFSRNDCRDGESQFFIFQGIGFYHYFAGRMAKALKNSEKALTAALSANFLYGRAMSMDLKGHTLIQTGNVGLGLETLNIADRLASQLGASWLSEAIRVSMISYRSRFGIDPETSMDEIRKKLKSLSKQDVYSQSTLLLDLAQEYIRRGRLPEAKEALNDCCRIVYASQNRRHTALLNLRYAYVHYLEGDPHLALNLIRNALKQIDLSVDIVLELRLRGFEEHLVRELQIQACEKALLGAIDRLTKRIGETSAKRIFGRRQKTPLSSQTIGEDPFGDLMDRTHREPDQALEAILKSGYLGLLYQVVPAPRGKRVLYLDLELGSLTVFDKGTVVHLSESLSKSLRSVLVELSKGPRTKEDLIRSIWGYTYHPLRHDALIYSAIAKLRKLLGDRAHWLEVSEFGYQLRPDVVVMSKSPEPPSVQVSDRPEVQGAATPLNLRQQRILRYLDQNEFIDTMTCRNLFDVSEVTASRDLSELLKLRFVARIGKGRGTKYTRGTHNGGEHAQEN